MSTSATIPAYAQIETTTRSSAYYEEALMLVESDDLRAAVIQLKNALAQNYNNLSARLLLGDVYTRLGQFPAAIDAYEIADEQGASEGLVTVPLFRAYLYNRDYQAILSEINIASRSRELWPDLLVIQGHAHLETGNYLDAEDDFQEAARLAPDNGAPLVGTALTHFYRGDIKRADASLDQALDVSPNDASVWFVRGEIKRAQRLRDAAIENYTRALDLSPRHYKARLARASLFIDSENFEAAESDIDVLTKRNRRDPQLTYFRALILLHKGEWHDAQELMDNALSIVDRSYGADKMRKRHLLLLAGVVRLQKKDFEQAYRLLSDYVDAAPSDPAGRMVLGRTLLEMNEPTRALVVLMPVLKLNPQNPELYALMGTAQMRLGNVAEATQYFDEAVARASEKEPFHLAVARLNISAGEEAVARQRLVEVLKLDASSVEANFLMASMDLREGRFSSARKHADAILNAAPNNATGHNLSGMIWLKEGSVKKAHSAFVRAWGLAPEFYSPAHNLAQLDLVSGDFQAARSRYELLLEKSPGELRAMTELVRIAKIEGKRAEVIERLEKIRSLQPDAWEAWIELADIYLSMGDGDRSVQVIEHLQRVAPEAPGVLIAMSRLALLNADLPAARRSLDRAKVYAKDDPKSLLEISRYMLRAGEKKKAEETLRAAAAASPDSFEIQASLVALYANQDQFDEAFAYADKVTKSWPERELGPMLTGDIHLRRGEWDLALKSYRQALAINETATLALRIYQAEISANPESGGRRVIEVLQQFAERYPGNRDVETALASAMRRSARYEEAQSILERLLAQDGKDATVLNNLAVLYTEIEDPRAVATAQRAQVLKPDEAAVLDTLGWALTRAGRAKEGLGYLREASVRTARHPEVHYHLAVALEALGRPAEALREARLSVQSDKFYESRQEAEDMVARLEKSTAGSQ